LLPNSQTRKKISALIYSCKAWEPDSASFARFAAIRRQSEDEVLKLATQERIAQDQHAFEREKLYKDSEVQDALTRAHTEYYKAAGDALTIKAECLCARIYWHG
jgi:hypothetical protein